MILHILKTARFGSFALALMLGLSSCHPAFVPPFSSQSSFDQNDKWGLVVMGVACDCPSEGDVFFVHWYAYDSGKQSVLAPLDSSDPVGWTPGIGIKPGDPRDIHYSIGRLPPGDYILGAATIAKTDRAELSGRRQELSNGRTSVETRFFGSKESLASPVPMIWSAEARSTASALAPRITVKPGEIIYIGDYSFLVDPKNFTSKLAKLSFNPSNAAEKLKSLTNVHGEMRSTDIRMN